MRSQLALPDETFLDAHTYNQLFTIHGSGMIYMVMTPFALGLGVYLAPLQIGAPGIAMPRTTLMGYRDAGGRPAGAGGNLSPPSSLPIDWKGATDRVIFA